VRLLRRLLEAVEAVKGGATKVDLQPACKDVVLLAEPGDAFSAFTASMNASAIASHVKSIETKFGLKVPPPPFNLTGGPKIHRDQVRTQGPPPHRICQGGVWMGLVAIA